ncbi:hypothetical protein O5O45_00710 [Hahella aquimaris]|uniref:hypothetical protein n=1 Tax=Hahella sp. HNIBRBA332 TaxID=3015983 RepID=UPI00273AC059|nr:hypothetical protein [Hahella sp. HNIBRBA332]WLQ14456.1 hypothetical protein O5O45_00710 [Hahella sp. HNIBRBA332]
MEGFDNFLQKHGLKESHIYLLELIPLIEMIWADGRCQDAEVKILYRYTIEHLSRVSRESPDIEFISEDDINEFLDRFTQTRPDPEMLRELRELCLDRMESKSKYQDQMESKQAMMNYCLDIAAASVNRYPYKFNERIIAEEKDLLKELFHALSSR